MNKPSLKQLIVICSLILLSLIVLLVFQLRAEHKLKVYYKYISNVDSYIESGLYNDAASSIESLFSNIYNNKTALMFLKRCEKIAAGTGKYRLYSDYALGLYEEFPGSSEIAAVAVYALILYGQSMQAYDLAEKELFNSEYWPLFALIIAETGSTDYNNKKLQKQSVMYSRMLDNELSVSELAEAGKTLKDDRLFLDSALKLLEAGDFKEAEKTLLQTRAASFPMVKAELAWDLKDYSSAFQYYKKIGDKSGNLDLLLFGGDLMLKHGLNNEAREQYIALLSEAPSKSFIPYRNLYYIDHSYEKRLEWINKGLQKFPDENELLVSAAWEAYILDNPVEAAQYLSKVEDESLSIQLFKLNMMLGGRTAEHVIGNFWNIYNANPYSESAAVSFANFLLKNKQWEQLDLLIKRYRGSGNDDSWPYTYSAVSKAMQGEYSAAEELINTALEKDDNLMNNYNLAVILTASGRYKESADVLEKILILFDNTIDKDTIDKIHLGLSENFYNSGNYENALYYINKVRSEEVNSINYNLLRNKIQDRIND
ncbi:MAG: hypothetical protein PQJ61_10500 [Spirochaetales bacterium]|uniref:Tetratricopeptide repeat protein n=1 Tax=Candidatus Thalassospirochaeta sargassi TaxID=3119039 RepID=A0AAJ1MP40_9SPIO|nr:hypothetical protein [Spirochaetales bacterium]